MSKLAAIVGLVAGLALNAMAGTQFYGPGGQYLGSAQPNWNGNGYSYYGPGGQYEGSATRNWNGNGYSYYGPGGQYLGNSSNSPY